MAWNWHHLVGFILPGQDIYYACIQNGILPAGCIYINEDFIRGNKGECGPIRRPQAQFFNSLIDIKAFMGCNKCIRISVEKNERSMNSFIHFEIGNQCTYDPER